jgi:hypothetical protein
MKPHHIQHFAMLFHIDFRALSFLGIQIINFLDWSELTTSTVVFTFETFESLAVFLSLRLQVMEECVQ